MKGLALMLTAAMLVFTLTACGCSADTAGNTGNAGTQSDSAVMDSGSANNGTSANGGTQNPIEEGVNDVTDSIGNAAGDVANGIGNAVDDMTGQNGTADGDVTYGQMLNRGRVSR